MPTPGPPVTTDPARRALQCQATLVLPEGDLTLAGVVGGATGRGTTAITGGTGSHRQARGHAVITTLSPTLIDLQLMIDR